MKLRAAKLRDILRNSPKPTLLRQGFAGFSIRLYPRSKLRSISEGEENFRIAFPARKCYDCRVPMPSVDIMLKNQADICSDL